MRLIKVGIANVPSTVGAVGSNSVRVVAEARAMAADGVTVACFPEQIIGGYPPEDLVQWPAFLEEHVGRSATGSSWEKKGRPAAELPQVRAALRRSYPGSENRFPVLLLWASPICVFQR